MTKFGIRQLADDFLQDIAQKKTKIVLILVIMSSVSVSDVIKDLENVTKILSYTYNMLCNIKEFI